jgi:hypothetical protein
MATYSKGTAVTEIVNFDRSTKVWIQCLDHSNSKWYTKDPYSSQWFAQPMNSDAFGNPKCDCECGISRYILSEDYES